MTAAGLHPDIWQSRGALLVKKQTKKKTKQKNSFPQRCQVLDSEQMLTNRNTNTPAGNGWSCEALFWLFWLRKKAGIAQVEQAAMSISPLHDTTQKTDKAQLLIIQQLPCKCGSLLSFGGVHLQPRLHQVTPGVFSALPIHLFALPFSQNYGKGTKLTQVTFLPFEYFNLKSAEEFFCFMLVKNKNCWITKKPELNFHLMLSDAHLAWRR